MRVPIQHNLTKEEVRRRLRSSDTKIADQLPGGVADVATGWPSEDRMDMAVSAMGQVVKGHVDIEERQVVFHLALPLVLSFVEPMVAAAIEQKGTKLLSGPA